LSIIIATTIVYKKGQEAVNLTIEWQILHCLYFLCVICSIDVFY